MSKLYYGAKKKSDISNAANKAVGVFGGDEHTFELLMGTCAAETLLCKLRDNHPEKWGVGATQFDQIGFDDVKMHVKPHDERLFLQFYGRDIQEVELADLAEDLELAFAFTRLKYKRVPEPIPRTEWGRAMYWKKYYNSNAGKGTPEGYMEKVKVHR